MRELSIHPVPEHELVDEAILCPHELGYHGMEDELLLIVMTITSGIIASHVLSRYLPQIPFTPTLLVLGIIIALCAHARAARR